jgi:hypothetical protein
MQILCLLPARLSQFSCCGFKPNDLSKSRAEQIAYVPGIVLSVLLIDPLAASSVPQQRITSPKAIVVLALSAVEGPDCGTKDARQRIATGDFGLIAVVPNKSNGLRGVEKFAPC